MSKIWDKFEKSISSNGVWGKKPSELSECSFTLSNCSDRLLEFNHNKFIIGNSDDEISRMLDLCLVTMNEGEISNFSSQDHSFTIELLKVNSRGFIYQWNAKRKMEIAQNHKARGVELFKVNKNKDAAYRFSKALKVLHSIPIDVETVSAEVESVPIIEIDRFKGVLYGNLAACYLKKELWEQTIEACRKSLHFDKDNIKSHYKLGVACLKDRNYEEAESELRAVLMSEPHNKAALEQMKVVKEKLKEANARVDCLIKKMFH